MSNDERFEALILKFNGNKEDDFYFWSTRVQAALHGNESFPVVSDNNVDSKN